MAARCGAQQDGGTVGYLTIDGDEDLAGLRRVGRAVAEARDAMISTVEPGMSTGDLDAVGRQVLRAHGARSAPRVAYGFPGSTCISVNNEAAHGVPSQLRRLHDGDLVNIDVSAVLDGYWADTGSSVAVGDVAPDASRLLAATRAAQADGMRAARAGRRLCEVGRAVERRARQLGFGIVRNLYGHGVGRGLHEEPSVPSWDDGSTLRIWEGLVLAIEPFLSPSATSAVDGDDGWTLLTNDGSLVAQHEHTIVVTAGAPIVITAG